MLVCAEPSDSEREAEKLIDKTLKLRIFSDAAGKMNLSLRDVGGGLPGRLAVHAGGRRQRRQPAQLHRRGPGAEQGRRLYEQVLRYARARHPAVACGEFGADMQLSLVNDGPVTIPLRIASPG